MRWVTVKKKGWNHENEWRYVFFDISLTNDPVNCPHVDRKRKYNQESINKIILGFNFFEIKCLNKPTDTFYLYDLNKETDCSQKEMISYLIEKQDLPLYWNYMNEETLELQEVKIRLSGIGWNKVGIEIYF